MMLEVVDLEAAGFTLVPAAAAAGPPATPGHALPPAHTPGSHARPPGGSARKGGAAASAAAAWEGVAAVPAGSKRLRELYAGTKFLLENDADNYRCGKGCGRLWTESSCDRVSLLCGHEEGVEALRVCVWDFASVWTPRRGRSPTTGRIRCLAPVCV